MTSRDKASLLLLSGGSLVGQNIVQGLAHRRSALRLVVTNSLGDEPSLADFDAVHLVPSTRSHPKEFAQTVEKLIDSEKPDLVIPCRDDDVLVIALLAQRRPDLASRLLCGSVDVARATLDKWLSVQFSQTHGLPFVPTWVPNETASIEEFIIEQGFPLLIKPRLGFASRGVRIVLNRQQLESAIDDNSVLVQRYLGDTGLLQDYLANMEAHGIPLFHSLEEVKHSLQGMIGPNGEIVGVYTTLHRMAQGISLDIIQDTSEDSVELCQQCVGVFAKAGWRGPINIQCQRAPDGRLYIYEYNGRFTGATAARVLLGYDEIAMALSRFAGILVDPMPPTGTPRVVKQPVSRNTPKVLTSALEDSGMWAADADR